MQSGEQKEQAIAEAIGWIQRITVERLDLAVEPEDLAPESKLTELEATRTGEVLELDSIDVVEVIEVLESSFETELLEDDDFREEFQEREFTIRNLARFVVERFQLEPGWLRTLPGSAR